jgi:hypothetical protein
MIALKQRLETLGAQIENDIRLSINYCRASITRSVPLVQASLVRTTAAARSRPCAAQGEADTLAYSINIDLRETRIAERVIADLPGAGR